jgi:predicted ATPase
MSQKRILISGAPGSGKSSVIKELESRDYCVYHEIIRELTQELLRTNDRDTIRNPLEALDDYIDFNERLFFARLQDYFSCTTHTYSFYDRSFVDVVAYMNYFGQEPPPYFDTYCARYTYDMLFYFEPWEAIYAKDEERLETFIDVLKLNDVLKHTYTCLGYNPIIVPQGSIESRVAFIEKMVTS